MSINNIGFKLKNLREFNNYSQDYLAKILNISQAAYSKIENGSTQLSLEHLLKISELYKIGANDLLGLNDKWNINEINNSNGVASQHVVINIYNEERLTSIEKRIESIESKLKI
jgi:transcriptional regulator with XRE-family HTH domain